MKRWFRAMECALALVVMAAVSGCDTHTSTGEAMKPVKPPGATGVVVSPVGTNLPPDMRPAQQIGPSVDVEANQFALVDPQACPFQTADTGCPKGGGSSEQQEMVELYNRLRTKLGTLQPGGWGCAIPGTSLRLAANDHAAYLRVHGGSSPTCYQDGHHELAGCALFSGVDGPARFANRGGYPAGSISGTWFEVAQSDLPVTTPLGAFCALYLDAPFHHVVMNYSEASHIGTGYNESRGSGGVLDDDGFVWDWVQAQAGTTGSNRYRTTWPMPGSSNNRRSTDGRNESPPPPNCASGWPNCGATVSIRLPDATVTGTAFCRVEANGTCTHVPHVGLTSANTPSQLGPEDGMLYAHAKLDASRVYRVQFFATQCGLTSPTGFPLPCQPVAPWWEWMTGPNSP